MVDRSRVSSTEHPAADTAGSLPRRARYLLRRRLWKWIHRLPQFTLTLATRHGRLSMSNKDWGVARKLFLLREVEYVTLERAVSLARRIGCLSPCPAGTVVDIGANIGTVCITLVAEGSFEAAVAFEPEPRNFRYLTRNVAQNGLDARIRAFPFALSSLNGTVRFELSNNWADHRVREDAPLDGRERFHEARRRVIEVPARRLEDVWRAEGRHPEEIALIWVDVQGHEQRVLEGAGRLLRPGLPVVAEFWPYGLARAGIAPHEFTRFIAATFDRFFDLAAGEPDAQPAARIEQLFEPYADSKTFTDLLLIAR